MDPVFGDRVWQTYGLAMYLTGCPTGAQRDLPLDEQYFERGVMVWTGQTLNTRIYSIRTTPLPVTWAGYPDRWAQWEPETTGLTPPPGLLEPRRSFGKVWPRRQACARRSVGQ